MDGCLPALDARILVLQLGPPAFWLQTHRAENGREYHGNHALTWTPMYRDAEPGRETPREDGRVCNVEQCCATPFVITSNPPIGTEERTILKRFLSHRGRSNNILKNKNESHFRLVSTLI